VDLDGRCPVIGQIERAYHKDPEIVSQYARSFVKAHRQEGILTSLKHFPGHGFATGDTHKGFVDITETFENQELEPFYKLIDQGYSDMIMVGHQTHRGIDPNYPATLSKKFIIPLLRERGYDGVVVSDDLHMGAILQFYSFEETIVNAINAGIDILVFSNNPAAGGEYANRQGTYDLTQIHATILKSIQKGRLSEHRIHQSYDRIMKLKSRL